MSDIEFQDFMKLNKDFTKESFSFLVNHTTLSSDNELRFKKNDRIKTIDNKIVQNKAQ